MTRMANLLEKHITMPLNCQSMSRLRDLEELKVERRPCADNVNSKKKTIQSTGPANPLASESDIGHCFITRIKSIVLNSVF